MKPDRQTQRGLFISLEGGDGVGKSTQFDLLCRALEARGWPVFPVREPGGTPIGEKVRAMILDPANKEMAPAAEALLYAASRAQLVGERIRPALAQGKLVLADRYVDSSLVYQGHALGLGIEAVRGVNGFATGGLLPDLTLLLDADPDRAMYNLTSARPSDRIERRESAYRRQVRQGYLALAQADPRIKVIDAGRAIDDVHRDVLEGVLEFLKTRGRGVSS
ncbi:MAG: dTMP kinase [Bacillota bacterium]